MKKILTIIIAALLLPCLSIPCAAKKKVKNNYPQFTTQSSNQKATRVQKEDIDECEEASMDEPANEFRSYGSAVDEDRDFARHQAIRYAKAALVDRLESMVLNVMKGYRNKIQAANKKWNEADIKQDVGTMSERVLENCKVVCSTRYRLSDGSYECSVCVAIPATMAETVAGAAALNEDERVGVEFHEEQFRNSYREELENFRKMQKEQ